MSSKDGTRVALSLTFEKMVHLKHGMVKNANHGKTDHNHRYTLC
jgi:hypothetical protein